MDIDIFGPFKLTALKQSFFLFSIIFSLLDSTQLGLLLMYCAKHLTLSWTDLHARSPMKYYMTLATSFDKNGKVRALRTRGLYFAR